MADTLKAGDVVIFNSHSDYRMTIESVEGVMAYVVYFHPVSGDFQRHRVNVSALSKLQ